VLPGPGVLLVVLLVLVSLLSRSVSHYSWLEKKKNYHQLSDAVSNKFCSDPAAPWAAEYATG
jgi:hypothetical protein